MSDYTDVIGEMEKMQDRLRTIRERYCEPKNQDNPRYNALSRAVSSIGSAVKDMQAEVE